MIKILDKKTNYSDIDYKAINNIKSLSLDVLKSHNKKLNNYNYSCSYILYLLFTRFLNYDIKNNNWINQDKFITNLDIDSLIKSVKFMCNLITVDELKQEFENLEKNNLSYAIGSCLKEKNMNEKFLITKNRSLISYNTYFLCDIKELMNNENYEAISYAGLNKLNKLIVFAMTYNFDTKLSEMFKLHCWDINKANYDDLELLDSTIEKCKKTNKPSIIFVKMNKEDDVILSDDVVKQMKNKLNIRDIPFTVYDETKTYIDNITKEKNNKIVLEWNKLYQKNINKFKEEKIVINDYNDEKEFLMARIKNSVIIKLEENVYLNTLIKDDEIDFKNYKFLAGDVATCFEDSRDVVVSLNIKDITYILNSLKKSALMNKHILYLIEDIPYQDKDFNNVLPNLSILRSIPNLTVYKPCDEREFIGSYLSYLNHDNPSVIIIPQYFLKSLSKTKVKEVENGAYYIKKEKKPKGVLIATGWEINVAIEVYKKLKSIGILVDVLSMPSIERFIESDPKYKQKILPDIPKAVIEFSSNNSWYILGLSDKQICGINKYVNENISDLEKYYKITVDDIYNKVKKIFN